MHAADFPRCCAVLAADPHLNSKPCPAVDAASGAPAAVDAAAVCAEETARCFAAAAVQSHCPVMDAGAGYYAAAAAADVDADQAPCSLPSFHQYPASDCSAAATASSTSGTDGGGSCSADGGVRAARSPLRRNGKGRVPPRHGGPDLSGTWRAFFAAASRKQAPVAAPHGQDRCHGGAPAAGDTSVGRHSEDPAAEAAHQLPPAAPPAETLHPTPLVPPAGDAEAAAAAGSKAGAPGGPAHPDDRAPGLATAVIAEGAQCTLNPKPIAAEARSGLSSTVTAAAASSSGGGDVGDGGLSPGGGAHVARMLPRRQDAHPRATAQPSTPSFSTSRQASAAAADLRVDEPTGSPAAAGAGPSPSGVTPPYPAGAFARGSCGAAAGSCSSPGGGPPKSMSPRHSLHVGSPSIARRTNFSAAWHSFVVAAALRERPPAPSPLQHHGAGGAATSPGEASGPAPSPDARLCGGSGFVPRESETMRTPPVGGGHPCTAQEGGPELQHHKQFEPEQQQQQLPVRRQLFEQYPSDARQPQQQQHPDGGAAAGESSMLHGGAPPGNHSAPPDG